MFFPTQGISHIFQAFQKVFPCVGLTQYFFQVFLYHLIPLALFSFQLFFFFFIPGCLDIQGTKAIRRTNFIYQRLDLSFPIPFFVFKFLPRFPVHTIEHDMPMDMFCIVMDRIDRFIAVLQVLPDKISHYCKGLLLINFSFRKGKNEMIALPLILLMKVFFCFHHR